MAYVVAKSNGTFEIREAHATARGPRSRTLVSFRTLTPEALAKATTRASQPLDAERLRRAAQQKGAQIASTDADAAAATLLAELERGRPPRASLTRLLQERLAGASGGRNDAATAAATWIGATPRQRGEALRDLLLLVDSLPARRRLSRRRFPRIESRRA
ncbi:MAG: hypothetical protein ACYCUM_08095 [Solirubrobacteraceae bacterium]